MAVHYKTAMHREVLADKTSKCPIADACQKDIVELCILLNIEIWHLLKPLDNFHSAPIIMAQHSPGLFDEAPPLALGQIVKCIL
jgi:hypothetical protein